MPTMAVSDETDFTISYQQTWNIARWNTGKDFNSV